MSTIIPPAKRKEYMDTIRTYMFNDIQAAIDGNANYLAALGLSTYTENLGGLYCGNLKKNLGTNYISFINDFFPPCYQQVDSQLLTSGKASSKHPIYEIVRCGLVHEYFMKAESIVTIGGASKATCGIMYDISKNPSLIFVVDKYFDDFKNAFNNYYKDLLGTSNKAPNIVLQGKFDDAIKGMSIGPFLPSSGLKGESGSGFSFP
jgi:hypothetical protein